MKKIYKYPLDLDDKQFVRMPLSTQILSIQMQGGFPVLWGLIDPSEESSIREFRVYGTGHPMPDEPGDFMCTIQDGPFVWHIFAC